MQNVIFPPRPGLKILPRELPRYEALGSWVAQRKFNGCRNLIHILPKRQISVWTRTGDAHSRFELNDEYRAQIFDYLELDPLLEYWLDSELMSKTKNAGKEIVLYDVLCVGRYLFGSPNQLERLKLLTNICRNPKKPTENGLALQISPKLWMAETFCCDFSARFAEALTSDQIEGLVLRKKDSVLDHFGTKRYEVSWMIRCRKPSKNYNF